VRKGQENDDDDVFNEALGATSKVIKVEQSAA